MKAAAIAVIPKKIETAIVFRARSQDFHVLDSKLMS